VLIRVPFAMWVLGQQLLVAPVGLKRRIANILEVMDGLVKIMYIFVMEVVQ
jgi:hypothetical protein